MERFNRAVRRHHVARLKHKRRNYWGWDRRQSTPFDQVPQAPEPMPVALLGKIVATPQMCSCLGCGNQRHNTAGWTPTVQERRWLDQYREQLEEVEEDAKS
jgi:hypothetical protein